MLAAYLTRLREQNTEILLCLGNSAEAKQAWLEAGGTAGHLLSASQMQSRILTGGIPLPKELAFAGSLEELIALFPKNDMQQSLSMLNPLLAGVVAEYSKGQWEFFTCRLAVMGCCAGEYFSIVNKKSVS